MVYEVFACTVMLAEDIPDICEVANIETAPLGITQEAATTELLTTVGDSEVVCSTALLEPYIVTVTGLLLLVKVAAVARELESSSAAAIKKNLFINPPVFRKL